MELRPPAGEDEEAFVEALRGSARAWAPWTPETDPTLTPADRFRREMERARRGREAGTHLRLLGIHPEGGVVGLFALNEVVRGVFQNAYASWQVAARFMGDGYGTEGVRALLDVAFQEPPSGLGLHRVQANIMPANRASLRIAGKVGFRREGTALRYLRIAGRWEDHVMHAVTREEWPGSG
jgi:ribosomal-protein-alanine N-acetyltransferase